MTSNYVRIFDTSLRDGEQAPGASMTSAEKMEVARGLANYGAGDARRILRKPSSQIESILGWVDEPELIHRDNLVLLS